MTVEETTRGCLDDIDNEVSRQAHTDEGDTPETEIVTTEDEIVDTIKHDLTVSFVRSGIHGVRA